ncbi:hypothetical protein C7475_101766 [Chitinophaga sp. S165]|nr:hypothetical protein C7475_101766 [Chitinophaga sp. S165]
MFFILPKSANNYAYHWYTGYDNYHICYFFYSVRRNRCFIITDIKKIDTAFLTSQYLMAFAHA